MISRRERWKKNKKFFGASEPGLWAAAFLLRAGEQCERCSLCPFGAEVLCTPVFLDF
jgi:hypothetical protein